MRYDAEHIGNRIAKIRRDKDYKQIEIANKLGMTQSGYSKIELGKTDLNLSTLYRIASALDVPVSYILDEDIIHYLTDKERLLLTDFIKFLQSTGKLAE